MFHSPGFFRRTLRVFVCVPIAALLLVLAGCPEVGQETTPLAVQGEFDLRNSPLDKGEVVALDGEWEFYWDRLLTPADFRPGRSSPEPAGYFSLPGAWRGYRLGEKRLGGTGQATFRLRLLTDRDSGRLILRLFDIHEAYRLWANGRLVAQSGVPGRSAETEQPARSLVLAEVQLNGGPIELVLQVSNHHFRRGGVTEHILAAFPGPLETARTRDWGLSLFFAGSMLVMGVYHIALYYWRRENPAPLFFGVYCLLVTIYNVTSNTSCWVASVILPWWNPEVMESISLACFACMASLIFRFLKYLYPDEFYTRLVHFLDARIVIFFFLLIFFPGVPLYWFIALCLLQSFAYTSYYIQRLIVCFRRGRTGAEILLVGASLQLLAGINDPLVHLGLIRSVYLLEPAIFVFGLTQSLVLAKRFSRAFDSVERLSVELHHKNVSLKAEMEERDRLEKKVVSISEDERRHLSHELHDSLCQQLTGARLRASALAHGHGAGKDGPALAELAEILKTSTRDAYAIARGLWPVEHGEGGLSLRELARSIAQTSGAEVTFEKKCPCERCSNDNITTLYRIAQEALTNAAKHSKAKHIHVKLEGNGNGLVALTVSDDGVGRGVSDTRDGALGTSIMAHRARLIGAGLRIEDGPQGGTRVICVAPCGESNKSSSPETT